MKLINQLILRDISEARNVPNNKDKERYSKLYKWSNESMEALFRNFSVEDKDVLTVVGSGDHVFSSLYGGAKSVDTFDKNKLAIYYYYLRKWLIQYKGMVFPDDSFFSGTNDEIAKLVFAVRTNNIWEKKAKLFWMHYLTGTINPNLFFGVVHQEADFTHDIDRLREKVKKPVGFKLRDITERYDSDKKYDVVILSNILEHIHYANEIDAVRENVESLLNAGGICVCSHLMYDKEDYWYDYEVEEMTKGSLSHEDFDDWYYYGGSDYKQEVGYVYRKRR